MTDDPVTSPDLGAFTRARSMGNAPQSSPPTTTAQQDLTAAGQRSINRVWEWSQSSIAVSVTAANIYCAVRGIHSQELTNAWYLIVGFYFGRTNHEKRGGVGANEVGR